MVATKRGDGLNVTRGEVIAGIAGYTAAEQDALLWLHGYAMDALGGSRSRFCEWLGVDWTTATRVWRGKYGAGIDQFIERVRHLRRKADITHRTAFVETVVTRKIFQVCDLARDAGTMVMISGPSGRSKTYSVREWQRANNHGRAQYVYAPEAGGLSAFLASLGKSLVISARQTNREIAEAIEKGIDYRNVLIVDEVAHLMPVGRGPTIQTLEWIRGLHDRTGCGVVLVATPLFERQLEGGKWATWFEQLQGRVEVHLRIPATFSRQEIAEICGAFVEEPDPSLVTTARQIANARTGGVRELFRHLGRAAQAAAKLGEGLTAEHLRSAHRFAQTLLEIPED
ncbi:MAG: AAA family ATPase [Anaerovoracaceae bacterium]|jgi:hypothetical protein